MRITPYLNGEKFDPEMTRIMSVAFEIARIALRLADRDDALNGIIAHRIIELAKAGEHNPDILCERVLSNLVSNADKTIKPRHTHQPRGAGGAGTGSAVAR